MSPHPNESGVAEPTRLVVVLPVYNESDSISAVLGEINEVAHRLALSNVATSVIVIDDKSPDDTATVATNCARELGLPTEVIEGPCSGLGAAMLFGLEAALTQNPDEIATLDADGQHDPSDLPTLHRAFAARQADIIVGSRWTRGGRAPGTSAGRALGSRLGNSIFRAVTGTRGVADATTSFRIYSPRVIRFLLESKSNRYGGYSFFSTTVALAEAGGYTISEVPIEFRPRYGGQSKLNRGEVWRYFVTLPSLRRERRHAIDPSAAPQYLATDEIEWLNQAVAWNSYVLASTIRGSASDPERITEVGAGIGGVTAELRRAFPTAMIRSHEPDENNYAKLSERFADDDRVDAIQAGLGTCTEAGGPADLLLYVNVLEHIQDDEAELRRSLAHVKPGGQIAVFVPAMMSLYGPIDARSGHYRRYSETNLRTRLENAGFHVDDVRYVDRFGVLPYWASFRFLNRAGMPPASVFVFNKVFVPITRLVDRVLPRRVPGKNVVGIATRPQC